MKTVFSYIRVSTTKQGEHGVSLDHQTEAIERYAQNHGLVIARVFEEQETAAKRGRPVFGQMLSLLRKGTASGVVMHKIDRSARNLKDWADLADLIDSGTDVYFANEALDLHTRGGRLSADIQAVVAADYIRNLREETIKGFYGRLKQGLLPRPAPIGYLDQAPGKVKLVDRNAAPLVLQAFELYSTGRFNLRQLAETMFDRGLRTRQGKRVNHQPLAKMLADPFYTGVIRIKKSGEEYQGQHEPIIPLSLFRAAQRVLSGNSHRKAIKHNFVFRGLFVCQRCSRHLVGERQKGHVYYRCHGRECQFGALREEKLAAAVVRELRLLEFSQAEKDWVRSRIFGQQNEWGDLQQRVLQEAQFRLGQIRDREDRLTDAFLDGTIDKDTFERRKKTLLEERTQLQNRLDDTQKSARPLHERLSETFELAANAYLMYRCGTNEEKRELLQRLSSNRFRDGNSVEFMLDLPFRRMAERHKHADGCPSRSGVRDVTAIWERLMPDFVRSLMAFDSPKAAHPQ